ncbi:MAG: DNA-binding response regulator [Acidobacteriota bacterium]
MIDATAGAPAAAAAEGVVLVVEDDALLGRALTRLLRSAGHRVELHDRVGALLDRPLPDAPACLVLDLHLPDGSGFDVLDHVEALGESLPAVVITAHGDVPTTVRAMKRGAIELLEKPFDNRRLLEAVAAGLERNARERAERHRRQSARDRLAALSSREREVLELVVEGLPNKRIASRLGVSEQTVKVHRMRIMEKTGADSLPELVRLSAAAGEPAGT